MREKFRLDSGIMHDGKYDKVRQASAVLKFNFYLPVLVTPGTLKTVRET